VSISTTRDTPSAFGLLHVDFAGAGACAVWAQAVTVADIEIAKAIAKALRIKLSIRGENPYSGKSIAALTYGVNVAADGRIISDISGW
jgi:hypothetical protein